MLFIHIMQLQVFNQQVDFYYKGNSKRFVTFVSEVSMVAKAAQNTATWEKACKYTEN